MSITKNLIKLNTAGIIFAGISMSAFAKSGCCFQSKCDTSKISIEKVADCAKTKGLKNIKSIELDNGVWQVTTQSKNIETEYRLDPKTCDFVKTGQESENDADAPADCSSLCNAAKTVKPSCSKVTSLEYDDSGNIEVDSVDSKGQKHEINVSSDGSKVINDKLDD